MKQAISFDLDNIINLLKGLVNARCEDGFKWYPNAPEKVSFGIWDITRAIEILENAKKDGYGKGTMIITDEEANK